MPTTDDLASSCYLTNLPILASRSPAMDTDGQDWPLMLCKLEVTTQLTTLPGNLLNLHSKNCAIKISSNT